MIHQLKTWPEPFAAVVDGGKTCELRKNDRDYKVGDVLILQEWNPDTKEYTGNEEVAHVTHIIRGGEFGLPPDLCVMSIAT